MIAAAFWPGVVMYDTVAQYGQVLSGEVDDWHPPIMVRLWQALHGLGPGTAPMFALQVGLYLAGFALIVAALIQRGRNGAAVATAILALSPLLLAWQFVVLKDGQMMGALVAALGIILHWRLAGRRVPIAARILVGLLLAYATLVRANAVFATIPLAIMLSASGKSILRRAVVALVGILAVIAVTPVLNSDVFGAEQTGIAKSQPLFDLAAIAVAAPQSPSVFTPAERTMIAERHCAKAFFWDPLGDETACGSATDRLKDQATGSMYADLAKAVSAHPFAYLEHRLAHWNSTERWLVRPGLISAVPPNEPEPNDLGIGTKAGPVAALWLDSAGVEASTPLGWPITWTVIALLLLPLAWGRRNDGEGRVAFALLVSALTLDASFLVVSIASDLRYHLWPMAASALALIMLSGNISRRYFVVSLALLGIVVGAGICTRNSLQAAPGTYEGMVHSASD